MMIRLCSHQHHQQTIVRCARSRSRSCTEYRCSRRSSLRAVDAAWACYSIGTSDRGRVSARAGINQRPDGYVLQRPARAGTSCRLVYHTCAQHCTALHCTASRFSLQPATFRNPKKKRKKQKQASWWAGVYMSRTRTIWGSYFFSGTSKISKVTPHQSYSFIHSCLD